MIARNNPRHLFVAFLVVTAIFMPFAAAPQQSKPQSTTQTSKKAPASPAAVHADDGEHIFQQNCSRCHTTPDGFSPRISGTVVRHMRVRASLSKHDEEELLRFLNP